jgi:nitroreductase
MDFFEAVRTRRSVRKYTSKPVPPEVVQKAIDAALLAPNSSNLQTWEFYWVKSPAKKALLVKACFSQAAARSAQELVVVVANPLLWKKTNPEMIKFVREARAHHLVLNYYEKGIPLAYGFTWLSPVKRSLFFLIGLFRPVTRGPASFRDIQEICIKSAALASENFMLAITAQGYATCPMEGIDETRVKKLLHLHRSSRVVMAISVGQEDPKRGTWGPQARFNRDWFVKEV